MPTLARALTSFLDFLRASVRQGAIKPKTERYYLERFQTLSRLKRGDQLLIEINIEDIDAIDLMQGPRTYHFLRACRRLWKFTGVKWPTDLRLPRCGQRERVMDRQEFRRLKRHCPSARFILWVGWLTGARPQELRGLKWYMINFGQRIITLNDFKSKDSRKDSLQTRIIPLPVAVVRALSAWHRRLRPGPLDPVFTNRRGRPWTNNALRSAIRRGRELAGLDPTGGGEKIVMYSLRHSFATEQVDGGMHPLDLKRVMGHAQLSTTDRYYHPRPSQIVAAIDRVRKTNRARS